MLAMAPGQSLRPLSRYWHNVSPKFPSESAISPSQVRSRSEVWEGSADTSLTWLRDGILQARTAVANILVSDALECSRLGPLLGDYGSDLILWRIPFVRGSERELSPRISRWKTLRADTIINQDMGAMCHVFPVQFLHTDLFLSAGMFLPT